MNALDRARTYYLVTVSRRGQEPTWTMRCPWGHPADEIEREVSPGIWLSREPQTVEPPTQVYQLPLSPLRAARALAWDLSGKIVSVEEVSP